MRSSQSNSVRWGLLALWSVLLSACTTEGINTVTNRGIDYRPVVDTKNVDLIAYERDVAECKEYAAQIKVGESVIAGVIAGAAAGAAIGAATGAAYGQADYGAAYGSATGGAAGLGGGAVSAVTAQETIIRRCLIGRGYNVLY